MSAPLRLRCALHAFPRRFRGQRSAEIEATFHEAELAGERRPYGAHALADVVLAGWAERARSRPPLGVYLKYRLFDGRLEPRWHPWMLDDVRGLFGLRRLVWILSPLWVSYLVFSMQHPPQFSRSEMPMLLICLGVYVVGGVVGGRVNRRRVLKRHGYDPATGSWLPPHPSTYTTPRLPRPVRVAPLAFGLAAAFSVVAPVAVLASFGAIGASASGWWGDATRLVDHQAPTAIAVVAAAVMLGVAGTLSRGRLATRFTRPVAACDVDPMYSDLPAAGGVSGIVAACGLFFSALPASPLIVPWLFVLAAGAVPVLIAVGLRALVLERGGEIVVWATGRERIVAPRAADD